MKLEEFNSGKDENMGRHEKIASPEVKRVALAKFKELLRINDRGEATLLGLAGAAAEQSGYARTGNEVLEKRGDIVDALLLEIARDVAEVEDHLTAAKALLGKYRVLSEDEISECALRALNLLAREESGIESEMPTSQMAAEMRKQLRSFQPAPKIAPDPDSLAIQKAGEKIIPTEPAGGWMKDFEDRQES